MTIVLASLASGLLGVVISIIYYRKHENRQLKLTTLRNFCANRFDIMGTDFTKSLNEIFISFSDSEDVQNQLNIFHRTVLERRGNTMANQDLVELFKSMCKDVGINPNTLSENFFLAPFNTKGA